MSVCVRSFGATLELASESRSWIEEACFVATGRFAVIVASTGPGFAVVVSTECLVTHMIAFMLAMSRELQPLSWAAGPDKSKSRSFLTRDRL